MITTILHCSICISIFTFKFNVFNVNVYNIKLISQKSNKVMLLARSFLQRIMFIKFISTLQERLKNMKRNCLYSTFVVKFAFCKKNLAKHHIVRFWLIS